MAHIHVCMHVFIYLDIKLEKENVVIFVVNLEKIKRTRMDICISLCTVMAGVCF